jgi:flagellar biosynthesis protein FlhB
LTFGELMADKPGGEPTEAPTEKRLKKAFKEGRVAFSPKVSAVIQFAFLLLLLVIMGDVVFNGLKGVAVNSFSLKTDSSKSLMMAWNSLLDLFLPIGIALFIATLGAGFMQVGFRFNTHQLKPKLSRVSPLQGFKRIFSKDKIVDMVISVIAMAGFIVLTSHHLWSNRSHIIMAGASGFNSVISKMFILIIGFMLKILIFLIILSAFDFLIIWFRHRKSLMMTKYEVEKEYKQDDGDPRHKAERKRIHMEISQMEMIQSVREADLVVVNPNHVAVAIKNDSDGVLPSILARGENVFAERIKKEARKHKIPIYKDVQLARNLVRFEPGDSVPPELIEAINIVIQALEIYGS